MKKFDIKWNCFIVDHGVNQQNNIIRNNINSVKLTGAGQFIATATAGKIPYHPST